MNNNDDLETFKMLFLEIEEHKNKYYRKKKKIYLLVATMIVVIMGMSMVAVGDKQIIVTSRNDGERSLVNNSKNDDDIIKANSPKDFKLYDQEEQLIGFPPPRILSFPSGTVFENGHIKNNTLYLKYKIHEKYLNYKFSPKKDKNMGILYDSISLDSIDISVYKKKSTYTAVFQYQEYYCYISSNVTKREFYNVLEYIHMI